MSEKRILIITNCTNRKRLKPATSCCIRSLPNDTIENLTEQWITRISENHDTIRVSDLYCGRSFSEALIATTALRARLLVASAGLGLIDCMSEIPSYSATISSGTDDCVINRLQSGHNLDWWRAINLASPYAIPLETNNYDLVMVAMSIPYFNLIKDQLTELPSSEQRKLRLFLRLKTEDLPGSLSRNLMPYDARLDQKKGPNPGTMSDFAQRALRHFSENIFSKSINGDAIEHQKYVADSLMGFLPPSLISGRRTSDQDILHLIEKYWITKSPSASKMLRLFRDELGVACEQKRFRCLYSQVSITKAS